MRRITVILAAGALVAACSGDPVPTAPPQQLNYLRAASTAPALANPVDSFWAVKGQTRRIRIYYQPAEPGEDSAQLLEFKVPPQSLLRRPNGTLFATGDSVLIRVTVIDPVHLVVQFEPSGLTFSPSAPAQFKFEFGETDDDVNGDGHVNATDDSLKALLHLWRQETAVDPWIQLSTNVNVSAEEVEADILSFTNYALAY